ncbi:MAG TPA: penicillin-binding protein 2 [Firmicutes bacterium]|nr:penicillin-binding protein 2 [Bacillota bacterium]
MSEKRLLVIKLFIISMFFIILVRLMYVQIIKGSYYYKRAKAIELKKVVLEPSRGKIMDSEGVTLASSYETYSIFTYNSWVKNKGFMARQIAKTGLISYEEALRKLRKPGFNWIIRGVGKNKCRHIVRDINRYGIKSDSLGFYKDRIRVYPFNREFSPIIGDLSEDNRGLSGIEYKYNNFLQGERGWAVFQTHPTGGIYAKSNYPHKKEKDGDDIILTIDKNLQDLVYSEVKKAVEKYNAKGGCGIIMDPNTGDVLAMVNYPTFKAGIGDTIENYYKKNRAISFNFEPGSIFKIVTMFGALSNKIVKPGDTLVDSTGKITVDRIMIRDAEEHGILTVNQSFYVSSNVGMVRLAQKLGKEKFYSYIKLFGFGSKTGIDLPGEEKGILRSPRRWKRIDFSTIAFGQGIAVTPIQITVAYAAIANGGRLLKPHIVKEVKRGDKIIYKRKKEIIRTIPDRHTIDILKNMLVTVVDSGTGRNARIGGLKVAGKTGTAQQSEPGKGYDGSIVSSFVGFFPAEHPQFVLTIVIDRPKKARFASVVAAPCFGKIGNKISTMRPYIEKVFARR